MEDNNKELIENTLKKDSQDIEFEPIPGENESPLAEPVVKKSNTSGDVSAAKKDAQQTTAADPGQNATGEPKQQEQIPPAKEQYTDAPEQEINAEPTEEEKQEQAEHENGEYNMPLEHAELLADSIIGSVNNTVLEVGCGYFVTISKHKDFYDFEELIQVIDEQNVKNIKRLKLDEEDKALLRPLLVHILRKKAAALSPEKQLLMVALSIMIKKTKVVMEIRAENEMLVDRIRDIIRQEVRGAKEEQEQTVNGKEDQEETHRKSETDDYRRTEVEETVYEEVVSPQRQVSKTGLPDEALEVY